MSGVNGVRGRYLGSRHPLWGATLQQHFLFQSHLPSQRLLLKVLPEVYWREGEVGGTHGVSSWSCDTHAHTQVLTCDADVGPVALGRAGGAPGDTLTPVILQPKQLLHLGPRHRDVHLPHHQTCAG